MELEFIIYRPILAFNSMCHSLLFMTLNIAEQNKLKPITLSELAWIIKEMKIVYLRKTIHFAVINKHIKSKPNR